MKRFSLKEIPLFLFSIIWIFFLFTDYVNKHPTYYESVEHFQLPILLGIFILVSGLCGFLMYKSKFQRIYNATGIFVLFAIVSFSIVILFRKFSEVETSIAEASNYVVSGILYLFPLFLIWFSCFSFGDIALRIFKFKIKESSKALISSALGIMLITFLLFVFGAMGLLYNFVVIPILLIPIIANYKVSLSVIKSLFLKPWSSENIGSARFITGMLISLLVIFLTINYLGAINPFPAGFDSRNYYVNISKLLNDYNGLVAGFQPYNWSLFMSIGIVGFNSIEITLLISFSVFILALWAGYELCRNYLNISLNHTLLILLLFTVLPSIFNQMFIELKVDFGLLFIQLCSIFLVIDLVEKIRKDKDEWSKELWSALALIAIFSGFSIGIKLTHLYLLFAIVLLLWFIKTKYFGFLGMFFLVLAVIFFAKIDEVSGMSSYHLGVSYQRFIYLGLSILFFGITFIQNRKTFINTTKVTLVISFLALAVFAPWIVKNGISAKRINVRSLILGENPGPDINIKKIDENYKAKYKK